MSIGLGWWKILDGGSGKKPSPLGEGSCHTHYRTEVTYCCPGNPPGNPGIPVSPGIPGIGASSFSSTSL